MKILVEVSDKWARNRCAYCPLHKTCSASIVGSKLDCPLANAKEAVEVPASKHALQLWLGNPDIELYAVKEETK